MNMNKLSALFAIFSSLILPSQPFSPVPSHSPPITRWRSRTLSLNPLASQTILKAQADDKEPRVRKNLKKKETKSSAAERRRRIASSSSTSDTDSIFKTKDTRPLISSSAIESGLDYWISDSDQKTFTLRKKLQKRKKLNEKQIDSKKLKEEISAPYRENWIGVFSLLIATLSVIIIKFPELVETPIIPIPDL
ncbi:hypothetical protein TL16_g07371 [Triparma laevis f. inornata]|uniref:Uncharacterized protein n=2 Tax=Triparma laevis TaxID=1534972 RepID=A0A9W7CJ08_9STRA|nr:hypothetical protein TL16_g07371 [Triparma laevis f. inornata]GMI05534.1 hypothetical protein TrLO_g11646 [Triparma laevis f. longispina]